jgi:hypothetical protein
VAQVREEFLADMTALPEYGKMGALMVLSVDLNRFVRRNRLSIPRIDGA